MQLHWSINRPHGKFIDLVNFKYCSCLSYVTFIPFFSQLVYLDSTKFEKFHVVRMCPAILNWSTTLIRQRQDLELSERKLGELELNPEWTEAEANEAEGFIDAGLSESSDKEVGLFVIVDH